MSTGEMNGIDRFTTSRKVLEMKEDQIRYVHTETIEFLHSTAKSEGTLPSHFVHAILFHPVILDTRSRAGRPSDEEERG